jgi:putative ABC transport system permease protein
MPDWRPDIASRLGSLRLDPAREAEIIDELSQHLDQRYDELLSEGATDKEAFRTAVSELLDAETLATEMRPLRQARVRPRELRDPRLARVTAYVIQDGTFALRQLVRSPLVAAVAIVTLAIGIGLNTTVFTLVNAVLLRPLPYPHSERLVWIAPYDELHKRQTFASRGDYLVWKQQTQAFDKMAAYGTRDLSLVAGGEPSQERIAFIGGDYWEITGAQPSLGRLPAEDDQQGVVLSYGLFQRRFGGLPTIIGQAVEIGGAAFTIVGVLPATFRVTFPQQTAPGDELRDLDAFISLPHGHQLPATEIRSPNRPAPYWVRVVARLAPGISVSRALLDMQTLHAQLQRDYPRPPALQRTIHVVSLHDRLTEGARFSLVVLQGAVGFVLLIAVANVANLLLAQASLRTRETAVRSALGAGRGRLMLQFLVESVVLALIAGTAAVVVAYTALPLFVSLAPFSLTGIVDITVDARVLVFTFCVSIVTAVLFAWAPVFETSRVSLLSTLGGTTPTATAGSVRTQGLLISFEVALAVLLLTGAGLMIKSLWHLQMYPEGFSPRGTYTMRVPLSGPRYEDLGQKHAYVNELLRRLEHAPGVEAAGIASVTYNIPVEVSGVGRGAADSPPVVAVRMVSPAYLRAMGVSLVRGRWPTAADAHESVVVNETFARSVIPDGDPIGRAIGGSFLSGTIVGIAHDFASTHLDGEARAELYYPWNRSPATQSVVVAVRASEPAVPAVRRLVETIDRTQPVYRFQTLEQSLSESIAPRRFNMLVLELYAGAAAIMALVGTFGVVARSVSRRTRETAVRIAVGARPAAVVSMIVRQAMTYVLFGIGVGIAGTFGAGRLMRGMLYGVDPHDLPTILVITVGLAVAALVACCLPAARAARVDPVIALRHE